MYSTADGRCEWEMAAAALATACASDVGDSEVNAVGDARDCTPPAAPAPPAASRGAVMAGAGAGAAVGIDTDNAAFETESERETCEHSSNHVRAEATHKQSGASGYLALGLGWC